MKELLALESEMKAAELELPELKPHATRDRSLSAIEAQASAVFGLVDQDGDEKAWFWYHPRKGGLFTGAHPKGGSCALALGDERLQG